MPGRRRRGWRASRELAFKHVLIRDVAYGMLPEGGARAQALRGRRLHRGARGRAHRRGRRAARRALRPRRDARRRGAASTPTSCEPIHAQGAALPRGRRRRRRVALLQPRGRSRTTRRRASWRGATTPDARARSARSRATSRCGSAASTRRSRCGRSASSTTARQEDLERVADLHRKIGAALWHKGERKQAIEHHQKGINLLKDGAAVPRARAPLRGGRVALHADGRQHARDLRLREGAAPGRAARRDARGEPRARDLRPRVRPHRRHRQGAREPRARRSSSRAAPTTRETILALLALGHHLEVSEADYAAAERRLRARRSRWRSRSATCRRRSSCTPRSPSSPLYRADWDAVERATERQRRAGRARGPGRQALPPVRAARAAALARGRLGRRPSALYRRAHELAEQVGWSEVAVRGAVRARASRCATAATSRRRDDRARTRRSTCASAPGLIAQSIQAIVARAAIALAHGRPGRAGARGRRGGRPLAERLHYPVGGAAALEAQGATAEDPVAGAELLAEAEEHGARSAGRSRPPAARPRRATPADRLRRCARARGARARAAKEFDRRAGDRAPREWARAVPASSEQLRQS